LIGKASEKMAHKEGADTAMVEARGVEKEYATGDVRVQALRGVDLSISRGEMVAIMGPSGCGKTTLLNCLSGLDEFDGGEVLVGGESISGMSDRKRTRFRAEKMGFVFQTYNLIPVLSAVTVARSLVNHPAIVWADEPTGALDSETSGEIVELLVKLNREQGQTFVLVTHDASVARRAHRIVRMRDGMIEGDEPTGTRGHNG
jgi:putative ABC transport system ATP-binding protein